MSFNPYARTQAELDAEYEGHRVRADREKDADLDTIDALRDLPVTQAVVDYRLSMLHRAMYCWRANRGEAREWWRWQVGVCIDDLRSARAKLELAETIIECGRIG